MTSTTLVKTLLHNSVADSVYKEITSRTGRYYYFLGSTLEWDNPTNPPVPIDSYSYERDTRKNIIIVKEIQPSDVSYVVNRINWTANTVYDIYDDEYSSQLIGIDLISGGSNYSSNVTLSITGGGGTGANATATVSNGAITSIALTSRGFNYNTSPNVTIIDSFGTGAVANAKINYAYSGAANLQSAQFYVVTDEFNVYKCLDNNNDSESTVKPVLTSPEAFFTTDGYKWKFLGTVPIGLRNKFLTTTQIPIRTSITDQFYSSGEIKNVSIIDTGNNYTYASIVVQGDGYLESDPFVITNYNVANIGNTGYTTATVTIDDPVSGATNWQPNTEYTIGQILKFNNNIYDVVKRGTTSTNGPVHTIGTASNGTASLKFRGRGISATANIVNGNILSLSNFVGILRDIVITNGGSGYIDAPTITLSGGGGSNAAAYSVVTDNTVRRVVVLDRGSNYISAPSVTFGTEWQANANVSPNTQIFNGTRLYTVTTGGYVNTLAPTHTTGVREYGNANLAYAGVPATGTSRIQYGAGYSSIPSVVITGDGANANIVLTGSKTEAIIYPYVEEGRITRVIIEDGGIGYTTATLTVVGDGGNADLRPVLSESDLDSLQATSELLSVPGAIHTIKVVSEGYGYSTADVTIVGDGTGATANATIINGKITKINVLTEGQGYTRANVNITGTGFGATARAILPPYRGHGKDIVGELFARNLAFYSTIGQEENQGLVVDNDYRQFGIIKDIRNYTNNKFYNNLSGSGCWLLSGTFDTTLFRKDVTITRTSDSSRFLIVAATVTGILVISLDNGIPSTSDVVSEPTGTTVVLSGVTTPDVDKYSGELLYIDNRQAFSSTEDQSVSLKTVLKY